MLLNGGHARIWYKTVSEENNDRLRNFRRPFALLRSLDVKSMHTFQKNNISPSYKTDLQYITPKYLKREIYTSILDVYNRSHSILHDGVFRHGQLVPYIEYSLLHL
jgi:hypothetical protein